MTLWMGKQHENSWIIYRHGLELMKKNRIICVKQFFALFSPSYIVYVMLLFFMFFVENTER